ncbi:MAG TPA: SRPBCC family protein [Phycicoccus sp.]|nr:SRPBCC family protein [Phycicoccus sp.]HQK32150.1 SRPBCC family protein [Phycicoccus sp.]
MLSTYAVSSARAEDLWAVVSDVAAWPDRLPTFTSVVHVDEAAPIGPGSRFNVRQPGLPPTTYEVTEWTPGHGFTWVARSLGVTTTATHVVTSSDTGSRLDLTIRWDGPLARPLELLLGRRAQRMIELEATTLTRVAATAE